MYVQTHAEYQHSSSRWVQKSEDFLAFVSEENWFKVVRTVFHFKAFNLFLILYFDLLLFCLTHCKKCKFVGKNAI